MKIQNGIPTQGNKIRSYVNVACEDVCVGVGFERLCVQGRGVRLCM